MIVIGLILMVLTFSILCCLAAIESDLKKIIDNQDIIKCIEKNK